jgi:Protein of unknown function (DUF2510)
VSNPTNPGQAVAGWYPTSPGSPQLRWWDGNQWTEHFSSPLGAPAGTSPYTIWIWIFSFLPLLQLVELAFLPQFVESGSGTLAVDAVAVLTYTIMVVVAAIDYRVLKSRGVVQPFHWAWIFVSTLAYPIGRAVVIRRRLGSGLAPLWVFILTNVVVIMVVVTVVFSIATETVPSGG